MHLLTELATLVIQSSTQYSTSIVFYQQMLLGSKIAPKSIQTFNTVCAYITCQHKKFQKQGLSYKYFNTVFNQHSFQHNVFTSKCSQTPNDFFRIWASTPNYTKISANIQHNMRMTSPVMTENSESRVYDNRISYSIDIVFNTMLFYQQMLLHSKLLLSHLLQLHGQRREAFSIQCKALITAYSSIRQNFDFLKLAKQIR